MTQARMFRDKKMIKDMVADEPEIQSGVHHHHGGFFPGDDEGEDTQTPTPSQAGPRVTAPGSDEDVVFACSCKLIFAK